jgi:hypothetical protein
MIISGNAVRTLSPVGDWTLGGGTSSYLQGNSAIAQQINCGLLQFLGECFWDAGAGINWVGFLGSKNPAGLTLAISAVILNSPNVVGLADLPAYSLTDSTRLFSVNWAVNTIFSRNFRGSFLAPAGMAV